MNTILQNWQAGRGFPNTLVIDGHIHFDGGFVGQTWDAVAPAAEYALRVMDANGLDLACVVGGGFYGPGNDYTRGNDDLLEFCRIAPDRFIGFAHYIPNDSEAGLDAELERTFQMGFRCIKLLNAYQESHPGDSPQMMRIYRFAARHNMLILNHFWTPEVLDRIAREFPTVNFITGHWFPNPVLRLPNVYCNIWGLLSLGGLERGVKEYGADKFLMGSDGFLNPVTVGIGLVVQADFPDSDKRKILGLTQARLLKAVGVLPVALTKILMDAP